MSEASQVSNQEQFQRQVDDIARVHLKKGSRLSKVARSTRFRTSSLALLPQGTTRRAKVDSSKPRMDRSRSRVCLPSELVAESLRIAHLNTLREDEIYKLKPKEIDPSVVEALTKSGLASGGELDPLAASLLGTVNNSSLMAVIELSCGDDESITTIWATPRQAVATTTLDVGDSIEFRPLAVHNLPYALADIAALPSSSYVGKSPISVSVGVVDQALEAADRKMAIELLTQAGGLNQDHARLIMEFHEDSVRHWRIGSTWSTSTGQDSADIKGLDAGDSGQWLVAITGTDDNPGQMTFVPQGPGDTAKALRKVLPKHWVGKSLNAPPI